MTSAVACLDPETIAAYLDRRLDPAERARVEEHLADCEECRTLLSETAHLLEDEAADAAAKPADVVALASPARPARTARRPWVWSGVAAAAAILVGTPFVLRQMRPTPESALRDLDRALDGKRYIEARLSGFEYGEYVSPKRGPRDSELPPAVLGAAGHVQELASKADTPENLAALGVSQLAIGRFDDAIQSLEDAVLLAPKNARIQSDLAAAYLTRFRASVPEDHPEDPAKAVEAAATAVALDPQSRAAAFNRAFALELLPLPGEAQRAWDAYLALDPSSKWATEARGRIEELKRPLPPPPPSPSAKLDELESDVFPRWGRAVLASKDAEAQSAILRAQSIALEIERLDGDRLALETLATIALSPPSDIASLASAHVLVGEGRSAYLAGHFDDADHAFAQALALFRERRSPYADWVVMRHSATRYQLGDVANARELAEALGDSLEGGRTLSMRLYRMRGLLAGQRGDFAGALDHYRQALPAIVRQRTDEDIIALQFLIAEVFDLLGQPTEAWRHLRVGLEDLPRTPATRQRQARLLETATHCSRQGRPRLAIYLLDELLSQGAAVPPRSQAIARTLRARVQVRIGDTRTALTTLEEVKTTLRQLDLAGAPQPRLWAEWWEAIGDASLDQDPWAAVDAYSKAAAEYETSGSRWRLVSIYLERARGHLKAGSLDSSDQDVAQALTIAEEQRRSLPAAQMRLLFAAQSDELFSTRLESAVARGTDPVTLLALSESGRARTLQEALLSRRSLDLASLGSSLPPSTTLVTYAVLADRLLLWRIDARGCVGWSEQLSRDDLRTLTTRLLRALRTQSTDTSTSERLYDVLVRPALTSSTRELVLAPDSYLHLVPFAALFDRQSKQYLIQQVTLSIAPSATLYLQSPTRRTSRPRSLLALAAPQVELGERDYLPALPFAQEEARQAAAQYARSVLLIGRRATKRALLNEAARVDVVHFAGHAITNHSEPSLSRLLLASDGTPGSSSLFPSEIHETRLEGTSVVVLAACGAGQGPTLGGEGPMSLARPFLAAGVPVVVASLWDLDDRHSATLLSRFHERLAQGTAASHALRAAQLDLLTSEESSVRHPAAWSGIQAFVTRASEMGT